MSRLALLTAALLLAACASTTPEPEPENPHMVSYVGDSGPGVGKHIVFLAGDHEYRSEELLPALARIMARHYGFQTSVLFTLNEEGFIEPGSSNMRGLEVLETADLMVVGLRFQDFPEEEMQHFVNYLERGGPVVGIRTSTHAFRISEGPHVKYTWNYEGEDYPLGFGRQVLGETWAGHYGTNHEQSSLILLNEEEATHPILRGVSGVHVQSGGYEAHPEPPFTVLGIGQVLNGMSADAEPDPEKELLPVAWTRTYQGANGTSGRVFTSTHGASEDLLNDGFRRLMVNAVLWTVGMDDEIRPDGPTDFVGPFNPVTFAFDGYRIGVRPSDMAGWDTPIMSTEHPTTSQDQ
ncbi:MAG: hypothetical protein HKN29_13120 [Rhodothermales bacterium]|nr:hypothetical protein [Rhodothermales bacterium]